MKESRRQQPRGTGGSSNSIIQPAPDVSETEQKIVLERVARETTEELLRETEELFQSLVDSVTEYAIFLLDPDGRIETWNSGAERIYDYVPAEIVGKHYSCLLPEDERARQSPEDRLRVAAGTTRVWEEGVRVRRDGTRFRAEVLRTALFRADGSVRGFSTVTRDVTEHSRTMQELRSFQQRVQLHFINTPLAVIEWDVNFRVTEWNPSAERIFGYTRAEALGRHAWELVVPETARPHVERVWGQLLLQSGGARSTNENITKDGKTILCDWYNTPLIDPGERVMGVASLVLDLTEQRQLEAQLRQAQKLEGIGLLSGGIAHDFNNLLNVIIGYSDLLLEELPVGRERARVEQIKKAADKAASLTLQLLAFSRKQVLEPRVLDVNKILADMQKLLQRLIGENIELRVFPRPDLWPVKADPSQLEQVVMNLAVNARDAMPNGGTLTLETDNVYLDENYARAHVAVSPGGYVMLAVSDTGEGMDADTQARIFEPFFTTKEKGRGTGLGLSTVYGIVKQSEGNIWVYSEPGQGTTFKIYLPRVDAGATKEALTPPNPRRWEHPATILLVEDDAALREFACECLAKSGFMPISAQNPAEALAIASRSSVSIPLVVTDVVLPGMSGKQMAEKLKAITPGIKVLYVSGYTENVIAHHGVLDHGINFLQKPYRAVDLVSKVADLLNESSGRHE